MSPASDGPNDVTAGALTFGCDSAGWDENPEAEVVVFLHGFPDTRATFREQLPAVAAAGFRAVSVSLRGYEPTSIPSDGDHSLTSLASDVIAAIDALGVERVHLVGHDWGAAISYIAGASAPHRFHSITTIAVPPVGRIPGALRRVPVQLLKSWYMTFFQLRVVSDRALVARDWWLLRLLWRRWSPGWNAPPGHLSGVIEAFGQPGVVRSTLAYYRQNATPPILLGLRTTDAMEMTTVPVPTMAITGADDGCIDTRLFDHTLLEGDFPAGHVVRRVPGAGHFVHLERPDEVNELLLEWFTTR